MQKFCKMSWTDAKKTYNKTPEEYLWKYCFSAAWVSAVLKEGFKLAGNESKLIPTSGKINGYNANWSLGALLSRHSKWNLRKTELVTRKLSS